MFNVIPGIKVNLNVTLESKNEKIRFTKTIQYLNTISNIGKR